MYAMVCEWTYASLIKANQSPEYAMPTIAYDRFNISIHDCYRGGRWERTFSYRLSAYTNSACLSTSVIPCINPTPEFEDPMRYEANRVGNEATGLR